MQVRETMEDLAKGSGLKVGLTVIGDADILFNRRQHIAIDRSEQQRVSIRLVRSKLHW